LSVLLARQSTNFLDGFDAARVAHLLSRIQGREAAVLQGASHGHLVWSRPYRTPFTQLLTFIGHRPIKSLVTVPWRAIRKQVWHDDDIPTIGHLQHLHLGTRGPKFMWHHSKMMTAPVAARRIPPSIRVRSRRKLDMINAAMVIDDLRVPPGNMLEVLRGDRKGQHSYQ
jgi:hypothetical protein